MERFRLAWPAADASLESVAYSTWNVGFSARALPRTGSELCGAQGAAHPASSVRMAEIESPSGDRGWRSWPCESCSTSSRVFPSLGRRCQEDSVGGATHARCGAKRTLDPAQDSFASTVTCVQRGRWPIGDLQCSAGFCNRTSGHILKIQRVHFTYAWENASLFPACRIAPKGTSDAWCCRNLCVSTTTPQLPKAAHGGTALCNPSQLRGGI
jgi:hypothetical protein